MGCSSEAVVGQTDGSLTDSGSDAVAFDANAVASDAGLPLDDAGGGPVVVTDASVVITEDGGGTFTCRVTSCSGRTTECGDCLDNDRDGRVDARDPECLGPCDNTEGPGLNAGVGGETGGPCAADCYFDFGNGPGNDDCHWDHRCDPLAMTPPYPPEGANCQYQASRVGGRDCPAQQSARCNEFCRPLTPNGCDCFGCCTFPGLAGRGPGGSDGYVWLGNIGSDGNGTCRLDRVTDQTACPPCTPVPNCLNDCGRCEVCVGRPTPPADCFAQPDGGVPVDGAAPRPDAQVPDAGPPPPRCDRDVQPCGLPGDAECPATDYCITGCCVPLLF